VYQVLRALSLLTSRMNEDPNPKHLQTLFLRGNFRAILALYDHSEDFVKQQALHLSSELGVYQDHGLKQKVLQAGTVRAIIQVHNLCVRQYDHRRGSCLSLLQVF
jgi:hypothetical protein